MVRAVSLPPPLLIAMPVVAVLSGCSGAPTLLVAGAYFPAWLVCALVGGVVAVLVRVWMVARAWDQSLPMQFWLCMASGCIAATGVWWVWTGV